MRTIVVTVYCGPLPANLPLWLASCAANPSVDWLLVTDQHGPIDPLPANVRLRRESLDSLRGLFAAELGFEPALASGYKLNDLKPLYFTLVEDLDRYDYWGFCDLDVCFGRLEPFLEQKLGRYDMILTEGHLRFFRNTPANNRLYRAIGTPRHWEEVLRDPVNFGLDEHQGINRAYADGGRSILRQSSLVADIDPSFRQMRLLPQYRNYRLQAFAWEDGRVFREYWHRGRYGRDAFLYAHFQKRRLPNAVPTGAGSFFITPTGFVPRTPGESDRATIARVNPWRLPNRAEVMRVLRMRARQALRGDDLYSSIRRRAPASARPA